MKRNRTQDQINAARRRAEKAARHEALMAQHAAHRAAEQAAEIANDNLNKLGLGPRVIAPSEVIGGVVLDASDDDLLRAAEELGIDLSGVGA
jgi:hypothetical protein